MGLRRQRAHEPSLTQLAAHGWQSSDEEPIWPSIRMRLNEASNKRSQPFLEQGASSDYLHGMPATHGSDTISLLFTASPRRVMFDQAPYGPASPDKGRAVTKDGGRSSTVHPTGCCSWSGSGSRITSYIAIIDLAYMYFSGEGPA